MRAIVLVLLLGALLAGPAPTARAFHAGGAAACSRCHIMHASEDGLSEVTGAELLRADSATDLCLGCHALENGAVMGDDPLAPPPERGPGNFVFLLEDNLNDAPDGAVNPIPGEAAGHSVVAPSRGLGPESRWATSPGGNYPSAELGCTSCHDPHGNGNYRMLWGAGPTEGGRFSFVYPAPEVIGISLTGPAESAGNHNAYRRGVALWCSNCHGEYHDRVGKDPMEHEFGQTFDRDEAERYAAYAGEANPTGGIFEQSYLPEVPFQSATMTTNTTGGPSQSDRVVCLTCHRAHASSAPAAGRWDFGVARLDEDGLISGSYPLPNPYPGPAQGSLCQKCHDGNP